MHATERQLVVSAPGCAIEQQEALVWLANVQR
jgi:hypothetical protein